MNKRELRETADRHYKNKLLPEALDAYARLSKLAPEDAHAWNMQAAISGMLGQYQDTVACCEKALALTHGPLATYQNYANALIKLSRLDDARSALLTAIELAPADPVTRVMLGKVCQIMDSPGEAREHFLLAHRQSPENAYAALNLAELLLASGSAPEAVLVCETALAHHPDNPHLLVTLIESLLVSGDTIKCREPIEKLHSRVDNLSARLVKIVRRLHTEGKHEIVMPAAQMLYAVFPEEYRFCLILADSQIKTGHSPDAIATINSYQAAPPTYDALILLATAYNNTSDFENTRTCLLQAFGLAPDNEEPVALLSRLYQVHGEPEKALQCLESFLGTHPDNHQLLIEAGNIHLRSGNSQAAEQYFIHAIKVQPASAMAHNYLGMSCLNRNMEQEAMRCFETAISLDPELLPAHCNLALLHRMNGDYDKAICCYSKALAIDPGFEAAIAGMAATYDRMGRVHEAIGLLEPVLGTGYTDINTLLTYASVCHKIGKERNAADLLGQALANPLITKSERMQIHFSIGRLLDRLADYDKAFMHYECGNKLNDSVFNSEAQIRLTDSTIAAFSTSNMKNMGRSSNQSDALLFIVGMPRSGTTLTEQILSSHPQVYGAGELTHICNIAAELPAAIGSAVSYPLEMADIPQEVLDRFSFRHLQNLQELARGKKIITDKMPSNFMFLGLIEILFPRARVIHCVRDPMDTCLSCYFQQFSRGQYFSYDLADLALYYKLYRRLMDHWKSVLSIPLLEIRYEELVEDTAGMSKKMLKFAGLDWDPACADFHSSERKVLTASYDQVRRPIYTSSVGRWTHYKKHLARLQDDLAGFYSMAK